MAKTDDMNIKARELLDKLYANEDVDRNLEAFCALLRPVIWKRAGKFISSMEGYDKDDFFQEGYIIIWRIALQKKPPIHGSVVAYFSRAIWYGFIDLYYQYALKNAQRVYAGSEFGSQGLSYYHVREIDYIERRKQKAIERARKSYVKKYTEKHGYPPAESPPKQVLSEAERKAKRKAYNLENRERNRFLYNERSRIDRSGVLRIYRLSALPGNPEKNEPEFILSEGHRGPCPMGARLTEDEYRRYMEKKYPYYSADIPLAVPQSYEDMLAMAEKNGILFSNKRTKPEEQDIREKHIDSKQSEPQGIGRQSKWKDPKEYYRANKVRIKVQRHEYYVAHREKIIEASKEYYREHREEICTANREYKEAYHDYILLKDKRRREEEDYLKWREKKRERITTAKKPDNNARQRIWLRAYRATHSREEELKKAREHYVEHRDEITAKRRAERQDDPEGVRAKQRAYRLKHKKTINAQRRDYYQEHKEKFKEWNQQYRAAHTEECKERSRQYYKEHKEEINQKNRQRIAEEKELSKTDPDVAAKREARLAKKREYNRKYREKKRAEKAVAKTQTESGI